MSDIVTTLVASGAVTTLGGSLIAAVAARRGRKLKSADYAKIAAEMNQMASTMSQRIADDLREDNERLDAKVATLQSSVDNLRGRVDVLTDALWSAIRHLERLGEDATRFRQIINGHEHP